MENKKFYVVYILICADNSLYCGITNNLKERLIAHNKGIGSKYTRGRRPISLAINSKLMTKSDAAKLEYTIKHKPTSAKISYLKEYL